MKRTVQMKTGGAPRVRKIKLESLREWLVATSGTAGREVEREPLLQPHDVPYLDEPKSKLKLYF